jgi:hypothetical protein
LRRKEQANTASLWEAPRNPGGFERTLDILTNAQKDIDTKGTLSQKDFVVPVPRARF